MKVRRFFGLLRHHENFRVMREQIKRGDTIVYEDNGLYGDQCEIVTAIVSMASKQWVFVEGDEVAPWNRILEWFPE